MSQSERLRARLERRRSSAASPHRNRARFYKGSRNDWKGLVMWETVEEALVMDIPEENIVFQREGSSQRPVEELLVQFVSDVLAVVTHAVSATVEQMREAQALYDQAWDSRDDSEALDWIVAKADNLLSDLDYISDWNDGYIIYTA